MLVMEDVSRHYRTGDIDVPAVRSVNLTVEPGTMTAVMGPSGCGKSTLLTLAGGLQHPDGGTVTVAGAELATLGEADLYQHRRRHIGYVFQDYNLVQTLTAAENVALPAELDGVNRRKAFQNARAALELVGMADSADRFPATLSGGQQQRVALARAMSGERRLILADEPTGALDSVNAGHVLAALREMVRHGATCVIVTHDPGVGRLADRVVTMRDGVIESATHGMRA